MTAAFTKGPWSVIDNADVGFDVWAGDQIVAGSQGVEKLEDAHLIAAAPELLAALIDYRARFHRAVLACGSTREMADAACEKADEAIAKATGSAA